MFRVFRLSSKCSRWVALALSSVPKIGKRGPEQKLCRGRRMCGERKGMCLLRV